ncbi:MAG: MBL fold metallo-hydrolase [Treponema sp.]|jgi:glyoxylase-like metal-dependent hydrolase (beta-lactamase superfamily II)|nr:MBL fold metallo-hydrolase [Treponema sp.]
MKLFFQYCSFGFSNCYILGTEDSAPEKEAIIVDPGAMNETIVGLIENNGYALKGALITHDHLNHVHGLRTLKKIYNCPVYGINPVIREHSTTTVKDGDEFNIGAFRVEVLAVPGHSADLAVYKIDRMLFTGDALSAGFVGRTASSYGAANQMTALRSKILSLPKDCTILPGHGPPSILEAERRFNIDINTYEAIKNRRQVFRLDY